VDEIEAPAPLFLDPVETLVFVDVETFGLDVYSDPPIEIGLCVTDLDLNILHVQKWVIWEDYYDQRFSEMQADAGEIGSPAQIVYQMHTLSGLWMEAMEDGQSRMNVEQDILRWVNSIDLPQDCNIAGSSVHFDYYNLFFNMELVQKLFHHRIFDISSLKLLFEKYAPEVAKGAKELKPKKLHRVLPDIEDTIAEFKFYLGKLQIDGKKVWEDD
jgi:oligoribonuclease